MEIKHATYHTEQHFVNRLELLRYLMKRDREFLAICKDYDICIQTVHYRSNEGAPPADKRAQEFQKIAEELVGEINDRLIASRRALTQQVDTN